MCGHRELATPPYVGNATVTFALRMTNKAHLKVKKDGTAPMAFLRLEGVLFL